MELHWTEVEKNEPRNEAVSFEERLKDEIYEAVMARLNADDLTKSGVCELHDIVNIVPTVFEYKKEAPRKSIGADNGTLGRKGEASSKHSIAQNEASVKPSAKKLHPEFFKGDRERVRAALESAGLEAVTDMDSLRAEERASYRQLLVVAEKFDALTDGHFDFVITEASEGETGAYSRRNDVIMISRETLKSPEATAEALYDSWFGVTLEETMHMMANKVDVDHANAYTELWHLLRKDNAAVNAVMDKLIELGYLGEDRRAARKEIDYLIHEAGKEGAELTDGELARYGMILDELIAHLGRDKLSTQHFFERMIREDKSAAERFLEAVRGLRDRLGKRKKGEGAVEAEIDLEALRLEGTFLAAVKECGGTVDDRGRIIGVNDREEETINENGVRYSIKYPTYTDADFLENSIKLQEMESVRNLTGEEFSDSTDKINQRIVRFFDSLGNNVYSEQFGDVSLSKSSVRSDLAHGLTKNKVVSFAAVPEVIQHGVVIESQLRGDGNYERIVVAAPIHIAEEPYYMAVMLQRDYKSQRLYLHDVVSANQKEIASIGTEHLSTTEAIPKENNLYVTSILQKALNVKRNMKNNSDDVRRSAKKAEKKETPEDEMKIDTGDITYLYERQVELEEEIGMFNTWAENAMKNGDEAAANEAMRQKRTVEYELTLVKDDIAKVPPEEWRRGAASAKGEASRERFARRMLKHWIVDENPKYEPDKKFIEEYKKVFVQSEKVKARIRKAEREVKRLYEMITNDETALQATNDEDVLKDLTDEIEKAEAKIADITLEMIGDQDIADDLQAKEWTLEQSERGQLLIMRAQYEKRHMRDVESLNKFLSKEKQKIADKKADLKEEKLADRRMITAGAKVLKIKQWASGEFRAASNPGNVDVLEKLKEIASLGRNGVITLNTTRVREVMRSTRDWYDSDSTKQMLGGGNAGYDSNVSEMMKKLAEGSGKLTSDEAAYLIEIIDHMKFITENVHGTFLEGKWIHAEEETRRFGEAEKNARQVYYRTSGIGALIDRYGTNYFTPDVIMEHFDGHAEGGFLTTVQRRFLNAEIQTEIAALGANPKVLLSQFSSLIAATYMIEPKYVTKGLGMKANRELMYKYCPVAELRAADGAVVKAEGLLDKVSKVGEVFTWVIGKTDALVVTRLWNACLAQVAAEQHVSIDSEACAEAAGKLLTETILKTQQNAFAGSKSAAARSGNPINKVVTMFTQDAVRMSSNLVNAFGKLMATKGDAERHAAAKAEFGRAAGAMAGVAIYMTVVATLMRKFLAKDDEDDLKTWTPADAWKAAGDMLSYSIGGFPLVSDLVEFFMSGFGSEDMGLGAINDLLEAARGIAWMLPDIISGKATPEETAKRVRLLCYAIGGMCGIPATNIHKYLRGLTYNLGYGIKPAQEAVYLWDGLFKEQPYASDIGKALAKGDEDRVDFLIGLATGDRISLAKNSAVRDEMSRLTIAGEDILPRSAGTTVTYEGEEYALTRKQQAKFREVYEGANEAALRLVQSAYYKEASDTVKAKALKRLYKMHYNLAIEEVLGVSLEDKAQLFAKAIPPEKLAIIIAEAGEIKADVDRKGNPVSGSRRSKVAAFVAKLRLSAAEKYMVFAYLGYKTKNADAEVRRYIEGLKLGKVEKEELLGYCLKT